jgi:hypothetical protein
MLGVAMGFASLNPSYETNAKAQLGGDNLPPKAER